MAVPNPSPMSGGNRADASIRIALEEARREGVVGRDITPFLLAKVNEQTGGESLKSNIALVRDPSTPLIEEVPVCSWTDKMNI